MASTNKTRLCKALDNFRKQRGLSQGDLARRLQISQPHLSRILSGSAPLSGKVKVRAAQLLAPPQSARRTSAWMRKVAAAAERSSSFRQLVNLALIMLESK
ncbi:helix-turn-helix domain-containing protein [Bradyrhizobium sp. USDA 4508]